MLKEIIAIKREIWS